LSIPLGEGGKSTVEGKLNQIQNRISLALSQGIKQREQLVEDFPLVCYGSRGLLIYKGSHRALLVIHRRRINFPVHTVGVVLLWSHIAILCVPIHGPHSSHHCTLLATGVITTWYQTSIPVHRRPCLLQTTDRPAPPPILGNKPTSLTPSTPSCCSSLRLAVASTFKARHWLAMPSS
jgi:hypothetical protein